MYFIVLRYKKKKTNNYCDLSPLRVLYSRINLHDFFFINKRMLPINPFKLYYICIDRVGFRLIHSVKNVIELLLLIIVYIYTHFFFCKEIVLY